VVFFDTTTERVIAAVEALRQPIMDAATGRRELTVKPVLDAFNPIPYADLAGALSVPKPDSEGFPVEITPEDWKLLSERLRPLMTAKSVEPTLEELIAKALPRPEGPEVGEIIPHTFGPNPTIGAFIAKYGRPYDPQEPYERSAFATPVKAGKNTAIYNAHSYHTKVPPQGIEPYIEHYTRPGDIVLDPFCGSGMTGVAALKLGRRVILNDLSPAATHIAYNYCSPVDVAALKREFERIEEAVKEEFDWLYGTTCDRCGGPATIQYTIWSDVFECAECATELILWNLAFDPETDTLAETFQCPSCGREWRKAQLRRLRVEPVRTCYECQGKCKPRRQERAIREAELMLLADIDRRAIPYWYPTAPLDPGSEMYLRGALHLRGLESVDQLYTKRSLWAMARLWHEIAQTGDVTIRARLQASFTASCLLVSRMRRYRAGGFGGNIMSGVIYLPSLNLDASVRRVWHAKFDDILKAAQELQAFVGPAQAILLTGSATDLHLVSDNCADYVFTDPPFGSNLFYADLNFLWEAWLGQFTDSAKEAVVNRSKKDGKSLANYTELMSESFREMHRVLKPGRWASVVFHNSDDRVWKAIQGAAEAAGFDLVNAMVFDKEQRSFKGIRGEKGLEGVTNFDIVLNLHKRGEAQPAAQPEAQERIEELIVAAVQKHLSDGPAPDYRTGQYLHSLAIRTLLNERISVELTWAQLEVILEREFRHVNCHWYLPKEAVAPSGHGFLVRSDAAAVAWLEHMLAANPQTEADLIPQWQIATLGAGSKINSPLEALLRDNFWPEDATGAWTVPTAAQREILRRRRAKPQQLSLGLEVESEQMKLGL
jgi:DNA modification methylase